MTTWDTCASFSGASVAYLASLRDQRDTQIMRSQPVLTANVRISLLASVRPTLLPEGRPWLHQPLAPVNALQ